MTGELQASVVICTYNRPKLLEAAVLSCLQHASLAGVPFEIVIADNSPDGHAAPLVAGLQAAGHRVRRVGASPPNISIARNAGLTAASAPLVAFLDDDLQVVPGWLDHFLAIMAATNADAAIGPVRPRFEAGRPPGWDPAGARFTRVLAEPSGFEISSDEAARSGFTVSTASSIWRRHSCFTDAQPFDPAFGASGGEDLDLFLRLRQRGRRFVWCAEAGVWETIQPNRTAAGYQALRAYSGAQVYAAIMMRHSPNPWLRCGVIMARGAVQAALGALCLLPMAALDAGTGAPGRRRLHAAWFQLAMGCGKLLWWKKLALYHIEKPGSA